MRYLDRLIDGLMYRDLAGRRRLRRYVLAAIAIFALIGGVLFLGWRYREPLLALGSSTPVVGTSAGQLAMELSTPIAAGAELAEAPLPSTAALPAEPASTVVPSREALNLDACPLDPKEWQLLEMAQNDNFRRIAPSCVYDGLARTVAWDLLRVLGYSAPEATEMLGFTNLPWRPVPEITGMTNTRGPMRIALANPSPEEIQQASHPNFHSWIVDEGGRPVATFTLRGCYRTESVDGEEVESWGIAYPVICIVAMDQGERAVVELGSHRYTTLSLPTRRFLVYGYAGDRLWISIGPQKEPFVEIRLPGSSQPAVLPLAMDLGEIIQDQQFTSGLHGLTPWDAAWLELTFGLTMRPLPENWRTASDPSEYQAIQNEKEKWAR